MTRPLFRALRFGVTVRSLALGMIGLPGLPPHLAIADLPIRWTIYASCWTTFGGLIPKSSPQRDQYGRQKKKAWARDRSYQG